MTPNAKVRKHQALILLLSCWWMLDACNRNPPQQGGITTHDSAGIQIQTVNSSDLMSQALWTVPGTPRFTIGILAGDSTRELFGVQTAHRLGNGNIVVANGGTDQILVFDTLGTLINSMGRSGQAPGEFRELGAVQVTGDTLVALDTDLRRATTFTLAGELVGTATFDDDPLVGFTLRPANFRLRNGTVAVLADVSNPNTQWALGDVQRDQALLLYYTAQGRLIDTVAVMAGAENAAFDSGGRMAWTFPFFGRQATMAVATDRVFVGSQETFEIREYGDNGTLSRIHRFPQTDLTITDEDMAYYRSKILGVIGESPRNIAGVDRRINDVPMPGTKPAFGALLVDARNYLWISEYLVLATSPANWWIYDQTGGGVLGAVTLPDRFELFEVGRDYVLGKWTDSDGVEYVHVYDLQSR